ncbi:helix-turn-helix domain-containing protein [Aureivirga sp. CE67]|uniref:helix-turn-helix domain-containing protein n=1 Tax=Aureivirga sp. CE67 TaxID=1788983 RepID=UPI0018CBEBB3|nr:AraC family transcriptional regulator [Aureivirga sp. CE67]
MTSKHLDNFFFNLKRYIVTKKNGFYILPYVGNSPEVMIKSLSGIPYNTHEPENNIISTDNPFTKGTFQYQKIEEGLWLVFNDLYIKKNISYKKLQDPKFPSDYYSLSFRMDSKDNDSQIIDGHQLKKNKGLLCKPKAKAINFFYKTSKTRSLIIFFTGEWLEKNIHNEADSFYNSIRYFIESEKESLYIPHFFSNTNKINEEIVAIFTKEKESANKNKLELKIKTLELLQYFLFKISLEEKKKMTPFTEVLFQYIYQPFPGIDFLAKELGISPSKLKVDFKKETGMPIFQYFREKQMVLAKQMLKDDETLLIKNVSYNFGYENVSKFSEAFKKYHGHLPSERKCYS